MVPGPLVANRPAQCRRGDRAGLIAGDREADEVEAQQQGGDRPVERSQLVSSRRSRLKVQA